MYYTKCPHGPLRPRAMASSAMMLMLMALMASMANMTDDNDTHNTSYLLRSYLRSTDSYTAGQEKRVS